MLVHDAKTLPEQRLLADFDSAIGAEFPGLKPSHLPVGEYELARAEALAALPLLGHYSALTVAMIRVAQFIVGNPLRHLQHEGMALNYLARVRPKAHRKEAV